MARHFEVEQKFRLAGFQAVEAALAAAGATIGPEFEQVDCYFSHPARDFRSTGEAFRVRSTGGKNDITYKGPRLDSHTKTRLEIELQLPSGREYHAQFRDLLAALGFLPLAEVRKRRRKASVECRGVLVEISLDEVSELGTFVELEICVPEAEVPPARERLAELAGLWHLVDNERRSYLELLLLGRFS
jgi:adenylate cyclase class 2